MYTESASTTDSTGREQSGAEERPAVDIAALIEKVYSDPHRWDNVPRVLSASDVE